MSTVLYLAGVLALLAGLVAIGFGSPASALDFGNTLIAAGTGAAVGGLVTIALAAAVSRLQRIAELLAAPLPHDYHAPAAAPSPAPPPAPPAKFEPKAPAETKPAIAAKPTAAKPADAKPAEAASDDLVKCALKPSRSDGRPVFSSWLGSGPGSQEPCAATITGVRKVVVSSPEFSSLA